MQIKRKNEKLPGVSWALELNEARRAHCVLSTLNSATAANSLVATVARQPCQPLSHNQPGRPSRVWPTGQHKQERRAYGA